MERKIGEIFEFCREWYQCVEDKNEGCEQCDLSNLCPYDRSFADNVGNCTKNNRSDGKSIIFKKLERVGEPYSYYFPTGRIIYFQRYECYQEPIIEGDIIWHWVDPTWVGIEIKQNKENNMGKKNNNQTEDTPLKRLVSEYINNKIEYSDFEKRVKMLYVDDKGEKLELVPFDLSKAKSGRKLYTRDGKMARIVDFESKGTRPIVALVTEDEEEVPYKYNIDGSYNCSQIQSDYDLFMASKKVEGWININAGIIPYETREEAEKHAKRENRQIKVSWED